MIRKLQSVLYIMLAVGLAGCYGGNNGRATSWTQVGDCCVPAESICCTDSEQLVSVSRSTPSEISLGREFSVTLVAQARRDCTDVVVKEMVPDGLTFVSSVPAAKREGNTLIWEIGNLCCNDCEEIKVTYQAGEEGCFKSCYAVCACPVCCQCVRVGCPVLDIQKCGTEKTRVCCPVEYWITVSNCGSQIAREVTLVDEVPPELQHCTCLDKLYWELGDICPGDSKCICVKFCAKKCGRAVNAATAQACNCPPVTATATTMIEDCCIELTKTGPAGPIVVGKDADYKITAYNAGNIALNNVVLTDTIPGGTRIKAAPGAEINGNMAVWTVPIFGANETKTYDLTITSCVPGCLTNQVCVCCDQDCGDCACATTHWVGIAGLWAEIRDSIGTICVGMTTEYMVKMQNQGYADDSNVRLTLKFPSELQPLHAQGPTGYKIDDNVVSFETLSILRAGETTSYSVTAKGIKPGDARVQMEIESDLLSRPYVKEEATQVY